MASVASSADHHDQSVGRETSHSGTPSRFDWNIECHVTVEVQFIVISVVKIFFILYSWLRNRWEFDSCLSTFLTQNDLRNKTEVLKLCHRISCAISSLSKILCHSYSYAATSNYSVLVYICNLNFFSSLHCSEISRKQELERSRRRRENNITLDVR